MTFDELKKFYTQNFSLGWLHPIADKDHSVFEKKVILISLICYLYNKNKPKNPDLTYYSLIYKLNKGIDLPDNFIKGLAIVCEDFAYDCENDFPTFGLEGKKILEMITSIMKSYLPF